VSRPDKLIMLEEITCFYLDSHDFNGMPAMELASKLNLDHENLIKGLSSLIEDETASVVFGDIHPNPHIRAFPDEAKYDQIAKLSTPKLDHACVYPLPKHLEKVVHRSEYEGSPFTLSLALGTPQLAFRAFDLSVLEHYRNDPRYYYSNNDVLGSISVHDEYFRSNQMAESDQVLLQTFGFCYDSDFNRGVAAFMRYLSRLSPAHQQIWKAKELSGDYRLHPDYFRISILGEWGEKISIFTAFIEEIKVINAIAEAMGRAHLFRNEFSQGQKPREFSFLVRPTLGEFNDFVLLLDKMISENISKDFLRNEVPDEYEELRGNGKVLVRPKGTLTMLDEWIHQYFCTDDWDPPNRMLRAFREIRRKRQRPAHAIDENVSDQKYFHDQRELMMRAYEGMRTLRLMLADYAQVDNIKIHSYVQDGRIWTY
jgi:hypothetical protein